MTRMSRLPRGAVIAGLAVVAVAGVGIAWAAHDGPTPGPASPSASPALASPEVASPNAVASGPACIARLVITNAWDGGFQANVVVSARAPLSAWTVTVPLGSAVVNNAWNTDLAPGATGAAAASGLDDNSTVEAGSGAEFGLVADGTPPPEGEIPCEGTATGSIATVPSSTPSPVPVHTGASNVNSPTDDDWLHTEGNRIVDSKGRAVWLTGANWFGFNLRQRVFTGLNAVSMDDVMDQVASRGINIIRVPISTELLLEWRDGKARVPNAVNNALNPYLAGKTTLEVFDAFLADAKDRGVKVFLDVHSALADDSGHLYPVWYRDDVTEQDFLDAWAWVAARYAHDDTVIGYDLKNEPHGQASDGVRALWDGSKARNNWKRAAERAGNVILAKNPHALIFVEGIEATPRTGTSYASKDNGAYDFGWWGGNLRMAKQFPVTLSKPHQLVYSPHEYGPLVYNQPWFQKPFTGQSLRSDIWEPNWLYLHDAGTAPLLIGEWGGRVGQDERQDRWMVALRDLLASEHIAHTFWCLNPESGDTGGLFTDGWKGWDEKKYALLRPALWQDSQGRFVSLDHATPLPGGVSVTEYYNQGNPEPS